MLLWASSFFKDICSFTPFWLCWVFIAVLGFPLAAASGARSLAVEHRLLTVVLLLLRSMGSRHSASVVVVCSFSSCGSRVPELGRLSCGSPAWILCGTWDLPGPGIEPVSFALQGGFLTTGLPGRLGALLVLALIYVRQIFFQHSQRSL